MENKINKYSYQIIPLLLSDLFQFQCSIFEKYICTSFTLIFSINSSNLISFYSIRYCVSRIAKCAYTAQIIIHQLYVKHAVINVITLLNKNYWNGFWFTLRGTWWMKIFTTCVTNDQVFQLLRRMNMKLPIF